MKFILPFATALFVFSACKKDRTCLCTDPGGTETIIIVEATRAQAKANCLSTQVTDNSVTYIRSCKLD